MRGGKKIQNKIPHVLSCLQRFTLSTVSPCTISGSAVLLKSFSGSVLYSLYINVIVLYSLHIHYIFITYEGPFASVGFCAWIQLLSWCNTACLLTDGNSVDICHFFHFQAQPLFYFLLKSIIFQLVSCTLF